MNKKNTLKNLELETRDIRQDIKHTKEDLQLLKKELRENRISMIKLKAKILLSSILDF